MATVTTVSHARWWALGALSLSILAVTLDGTVLSVALPTLAATLRASQSDLEWFSSGYLLVLAAAVLPAGLVGDRYGRKSLLLGSLAVFGTGSALCATASSPAVFLAARLVMGVAGAGVTVMALAAVTVLFGDEHERSRAVGIYEAANFLALPLGPILGGWMLSHLWWGWVFLINVPVVVVGLVVGYMLIPESRAPKRPRLDIGGMAASVGGLVALTYGLIDAGERGWGNTHALVVIAAGLVLLGAFTGWQRRLSDQGGEPLVDPSLFVGAPYTWGTILGGVAGLAMVGLLFTMPQYFVAVQGADTFHSGLRLLPLVGGLVVGALPASQLIRSLGAKVAIALGFGLIAAGAALGSRTDVQSSVAFVTLWTAVLCAGTGLALTAATAVALAQLTEPRSGIGSAVVQAFQKVSAPLGTAIIGSVLAAAYHADLKLSQLPLPVATTAHHSVYGGIARARQTGSTTLVNSIQRAFVHGVDVSLLVSAGIAVAGTVLAFVFVPALRPEGHRAHSAHAVER